LRKNCKKPFVPLHSYHVSRRSLSMGHVSLPETLFFESRARESEVVQLMNL
jgi:hypothetical protein